MKAGNYKYFEVILRYYCSTESFLESFRFFNAQNLNKLLFLGNVSKFDWFRLLCSLRFSKCLSIQELIVSTEYNLCFHQYCIVIIEVEPNFKNFWQRHLIEARIYLCQTNNYCFIQSNYEGWNLGCLFGMCFHFSFFELPSVSIANLNL